MKYKNYHFWLSGLFHLFGMGKNLFGQRSGFHLGFCLGGKIVCKYQLCVKHAKFLSPFLSINHQYTKKHKAGVFIIR